MEPNAASGFSAASQTVPSDGADLAKDSVHHTAAGISARCSPSPWESKQGRSLIPMEWSQVTGMKQSWICCSGCCWREKSAGAAWLAAGKGMRDVSSPFGRMNSLIWFGFPDVVSKLTALVQGECQQRRGVSSRTAESHKDIMWDWGRFPLGLTYVLKPEM